MVLNCGVGEDSSESVGLQGNPTSPSSRKSVLKVHWKDWCWSWKSNSLATCCEELTHLKLPWSWERLKVGGEGDERGWDGWMASPTQWTWVWVSSRSNDAQEGLACYSPWDCKYLDTTEWLNWTELISSHLGSSSYSFLKVHWVYCEATMFSNSRLFFLPAWSEVPSLISWAVFSGQASHLVSIKSKQPRRF